MIHEKIDTLCIVDDDSMFQFLTKRVIDKTSMVNRIMVFSNGLEAIEFLKANKDLPMELPQIILLDLAMPILDGWGFLHKYTELKPTLGRQITIYIVSSSIDPHDLEKARTVREVSDFILKPVTQEKFEEIIHRWKAA